MRIPKTRQIKEPGSQELIGLERRHRPVIREIDHRGPAWVDLLPRLLRLNDKIHKRIDIGKSLAIQLDTIKTRIVPLIIDDIGSELQRSIRQMTCPVQRNAKARIDILLIPKHG